MRVTPNKLCGTCFPSNNADVPIYNARCICVTNINTTEMSHSRNRCIDLVTFFSSQKCRRTFISWPSDTNCYTCCFLFRAIIYNTYILFMKKISKIHEEIFVVVMLVRSTIAF